MTETQRTPPLVDHRPRVIHRRVFISYSSLQSAEAAKVLEIFEGAGISCWIAPRDLPIGSSWASHVGEALETAGALIFIHSASANASTWCEKECIRVVESHIPHFLVRTDDHAPHGWAAWLFSNVQRSSLATDELKQLAELVRHTAIQPLQQPAAVGGGDAEQLLETAEGARQLGETHLAETFYDAARELSTSEGEAALGAAFLLLQQGRIDEARQVATELPAELMSSARTARERARLASRLYLIQSAPSA